MGCSSGPESVDSAATALGAEAACRAAVEVARSAPVQTSPTDWRAIAAVRVKGRARASPPFTSASPHSAPQQHARARVGGQLEHPYGEPLNAKDAKDTKEKTASKSSGSSTLHDAAATLQSLESFASLALRARPSGEIA
jgi:hypothetical protein